MATVVVVDVVVVTVVVVVVVVVVEVVVVVVVVVEVVLVGVDENPRGVIHGAMLPGKQTSMTGVWQQLAAPPGPSWHVGLPQ